MKEINRFKVEKSIEFETVRSKIQRWNKNLQQKKKKKGETRTERERESNNQYQSIYIYKSRNL